MNAARALTMASTAPARILGERGLGRIRTGSCADLVLLDAELKIRLTMVGGVVKYRR
jgi:N-acetylglucosamine-6-phosphate deacetylase